jgi:hypothetical protein
MNPPRRATRLSIALLVLRRLIWIGAAAFWMGGFSFYGGVVVAIGASVVAGGEGEFGFVTRQVTNWLNLAGGVALLIFLISLVIDWRVSQRTIRWVAVGLWTAMLAIQLALVVVHPMMDRLLDPAALSIRKRAHFRHLHTVYLGLSTAEWGVSLLFGFVTLLAWHLADQRGPREQPIGDPNG